jgi:hypothetical protein
VHVSSPGPWPDDDSAAGDCSPAILSSSTSRSSSSSSLPILGSPVHLTSPTPASPESGPWDPADLPAP